MLLIICLLINILSAVTIYEIQYTTNAGSGTYPSPYANTDVTTQGIVTATGYSNNSGFYISMPEGGAWKGILIYTNSYSPEPGSLVEVTGQVYEYNGLTEIRTVTSCEVLSTGNPIPTAPMVTTSQFNNEAYEGVLVQVQNAVVTQEINGSGEWAVSDGSGNCVIKGYIFSQTALGSLVTLDNLIDSIKGIGHYSYGFYNLNPRTPDDVSGSFTPPDVGTEVPDTLTVIQRPLINIPAIVIPGETFNIECVAPPSTTGWAAWLFKDNLNYSIPITASQYAASPPRWILTATVPDVNVFELYDLRVTASEGINDRTRHSVQVLPTRKTNYYFAQVTDVHMPTHIFSPNAGYDTDSTETVDFREVIKDINIIRPEFVLLTGDLVNEGELEDYQNVRAYTKAKRVLGEFEVPVYLIAGNHDIGGWTSTPPPAGTSRLNWWKNFGWSWLNNPSPSWSYHTQDYSFDYGSVHYVGMEGYNNLGSYDNYLPEVYGSDSYTAGQMQWLQADLATSTVPTKVLFQHYDFQDQINLNSLGLNMALGGHTHTNSGSLTTQPYNLLTDNVCDGARAYRIVRVTGTTLQPYATINAGSTGNQISLTYNPDNSGVADSVSAFLVNNQSLSFEHSIVKFNMPPGNADYTVTGGVLLQVDRSGDLNICYVNVSLNASSSTTVTIKANNNIIPLAPAQCVITADGSNRILNWQAVTHDINGIPITVSAYIIEASDNPYSGFVSIGSSSNTQFIDTESGLPGRFYRIKAEITAP